MVEDLAAHERSAYSQCGEDGVIERLFELFGATHRHFVEFGAKDGVAYSNTANLPARTMQRTHRHSPGGVRRQPTWHG